MIGAGVQLHKTGQKISSIIQINQTISYQVKRMCGNHRVKHPQTFKVLVFLKLTQMRITTQITTCQLVPEPLWSRNRKLRCNLIRKRMTCFKNMGVKLRMSPWLTFICRVKARIILSQRGYSSLRIVWWNHFKRSK